MSEAPGSVGDEVFVHPVVLVKITQPLDDPNDPVELYEAARGWWRVGAIRRDGGELSPRVALAVRDNEVAGSWWIDGWEAGKDGRWAFSGTRDTSLDRLYLGRDVGRYYPPGAQNPLRYVTDNTGRTLDREAEVQRPERTDYGALVHALESEALGRIMFGSLELFHSNFLAWFFDEVPDAADRVFGPFVGPGPGVRRRVRREWRHLDLVFEWPGRERLVIENKVKALPEPAQLHSYATKLAEVQEIDGAQFQPSQGDRAAALVLLSMLPLPYTVLETGAADTQGNPLDWATLSYGGLADRMADAIATEPATYERETVIRYVRVIRCLQTLVEGVRFHDLEEDVDLPRDLASAVAGSTLLAALRKMRARVVAAALGRELQDRGVAGAVDSHFSNGSAIISWYADVEIGATLEPGVQLQGGQLRRFAILPGLVGSGAGAAQKRAELAWRYPQLFDFAPVERALGAALPASPAPKPAKPIPLNHFAPDFVYRYVNVPELSVRQLADVIEQVAEQVSAQAEL